ncbi:MAG: beta-glucosidase BglX [Bacteroidales bacterium]|nr:beta-glucosidase BglX [Bacteroidales bacterium]
MKKITAYTLVSATLLIASCTKPSVTTQDTGERFVDSLMSVMTLDEKIGQLNLVDGGALYTGDGRKGVAGQEIASGEVGAILSLVGQKHIREVQKIAVEQSPHGIPLLFGLDVIHGYKTIFPIPLALAATWDTAAVRTSAVIAAKEATADGLNWTFSPMVDIAKDARWGRIAESAGEDPYLGSLMARAYVEGYQGRAETPDVLYNSPEKLLACVKHFALYGAAEAGLDYNLTDMSKLRMHNEYLAPYKAAVEAGVGSLMSSFNAVNYTPAVGDVYLLDHVLRGYWGYEDGLVVTDYGSIGEMEAWGTVADEDAAAAALEAGNDLDMCSRRFIKYLRSAVEKGKTYENYIDKACRRVLLAKYKLGLFKNPYKYCDETRPAKDIYTDEHRAEARRIATESLVLLKNEGDLLPLAKKGKIAVVGPLAGNGKQYLGMWTHCADTTTAKYQTLYQAISKATEGKAQVLYARGSNIYDDPVLEANASAFNTGFRDSRSAEAMLNEAVSVAKKADVIVLAVGESREMTGECASRTDLRTPETQLRLMQALAKLGKPMVCLYFNGRPVVMEWERKNIPAILDVWFAGSEAADAIADVLFGDAVPSGHLPVTFPQATGQEPLYYNHLATGRALGDKPWFRKYQTNYIDCDGEPAFPFGYGLSYTTFSYYGLRVSDEVISLNTPGYKDTVDVCVTVSNTGSRDAAEVVQLYIHDVSASIARPVKELKDFRRIFLKAGESQEVVFRVSQEMLGYYLENAEYQVEPGTFEVMVGGNSRDVLKTTFELIE